MQKVLVEVVNNSVMYNDKLYLVGQTFEIIPEHIILQCMNVLGEKSKDQTPIHYDEKPLVLNEEGLKALSLDGLKDYAEEFGINLGRARTEEGIIAKILEAQKDDEYVL